MTTPKLKGGTIWITGVTASGKTTLGKVLYDRLVQQFSLEQIVFLDGDKLREKLKKNYGYTIEDRITSLKDLVQVAKKYYDQEKIVIVSTISYKKQMRKYARRKMPHFMEVYLDCSIEICSKRDYKDHYRRAFAGEYETFVGVTDEYEASDDPELILNTSTFSIKECSKLLYEQANIFIKSLIISSIFFFSPTTIIKLSSNQILCVELQALFQQI